MILVDQWNMLNSCEDPYEKKNEKKTHLKILSCFTHKVTYNFKNSIMQWF